MKETAFSWGTLIVKNPGWTRKILQMEKKIDHLLSLIQRQEAMSGNVPYFPNIALSDQNHLKELNAAFRHLNKPTNVLTFPSPLPQKGDIIIGLEVVEREALKASRLLWHQLAHLIIHGYLHLAGHDHHHPGEARLMEMTEARILQEAGIPNPWKPRAAERK